MRRRYNRMKGLLIALLALAILAAVAGVVWQKVFVVRSVVIDSAGDISRDEVIRASQIEFGGHITKVDAAKLKSSLESTGKYALDGVEVRYPGTVVLSVRQRTRDAVVINGGQYLVLDSDGYVIEIVSALPENSGIYVYGLDATDFRIGGRINAPAGTLKAMKAVLDAVRSQNAWEYISDLDVSDAERLRMTTRTGLHVELGNSENMENKLLWMSSAVSDLERRGEVRGTLDVSSGDKADYRP